MDDPNRLLRWSEAGRCLRGRVLRGRGYTQDEPSLEMRGWWKRGEQIEAYLVDYVRENFTSGIEDENWTEQARIESQVFGGAIGTPDVIRITPTTLTIFELKSSAKATLQDYHVWQTRAYMLLAKNVFPSLEVSGMVIACDSSNVEDIQHYPITVRPGDAERIHDEWNTLLRLVGEERITRDDYPERVCAHPGAGEAYMCGVVSHCFADWIPEDTPVIREPDAIRVVSRLGSVEARRKALKGELATLDGEAREIRAGLARLLEAGKLYTTGDVEIKRTISKSERVSVKTLDAMLPREVFADAVTVSESERWTVKDVSGND